MLSTFLLHCRLAETKDAAADVVPECPTAVSVPDSSSTRPLHELSAEEAAALIEGEAPSSNQASHQGRTMRLPPLSGEHLKVGHAYVFS
jgi:hypothetical protein